MIQLIAAAAVGAVVWVGYSSLRKHLDAQKQSDNEKTNEKTNEKHIGDLEKDPLTGRYKPKEKDK
ncbi:MAG: hypothetical protein COC23_02110 [Hyphomicrobiales bacterium]|nr:MAG: hypothetical protein COC23_02110 [Hyphomicrobiales bacterium]